MSSSVILSNCLLCGVAALLLIPLLRSSNMLIHRRLILIGSVLLLIFLKLLIPYEFPFTSTLASKNILPFIREIEDFPLLGSITVGIVLRCAWVTVFVLLIISIVLKYFKLKRVLSLVPETKDEDISDMLSDLCSQKNIKNMPRIIYLEIDSGPFIVGVRAPIIVLPRFLQAKEEIGFVLSHELGHLKCRHILMKMGLELVTAVYWWNPVIWLLRMELLRVMEIQADVSAMDGMSKDDGLSYLGTLVSIAKKVKRRQRSILALSFSLKCSMVNYRVHLALAHDCFHEKIKRPLLDLFPVILSIGLLFFSFTYTFEVCGVNPDNTSGTFVVNRQNAYFILRKDNSFDLYVDGNFLINFDKIPNEFSELSVRNSK